MSMRTGQPLMWCDAALLTTERTAGATALAVDLPGDSQDGSRLAIIGSGAVALAHLRHVAPLRKWRDIRIHSPGLDNDAVRQAHIRAMDPRIVIAKRAPSACAMPMS